MRLTLRLSITLAAALAACAAPDSGLVGGGSHADLAMGSLPDLAPPGPCGQCGEGTPLCDKKTKKCVACLADADCPEAAVCRAGACVAGCSAGHSACGDAGSCDLDGGVCHGCLADRDCKSALAPFCDLASGRCGACSTQVDRCPAGQYCGVVRDGFACVTGCKADFECRIVDGGTQSMACCDHLCVDTATSVPHCGRCNSGCMATCCQGTCADLTADAKNCGACGKPCGAQNNTPVCANSTCMAGPCVMGFGDCNMDAKDGCETSLASDKKNCGACGNVCNIPNAQALCLGGACLLGGCNPNFRDCNGDLKDGCEANTTNDPKNCGACNANCANLPHAVAGCASGACAIGSCAQGFADCNKMNIDGCEAQLDSDPANCGGCGKACPAPPNVVTSCTNSVCGLGGCVNNFADCDNNAGNGCEANLMADAKSCGGCGMACPGVPNGAPGCVMGACGVGQCNAGFADCDKMPANGCELAVSGDVNNCGGCGVVCPMGKSCVGGACVQPYPVVGKLGNFTFYKVSVNGVMSDTNIFNTCKAAGMSVGCQAQAGCTYNDNVCTITPENSCGNPMMGLSQSLCGGSPGQCGALNGIYQYMGHHWQNDAACGVENGSWCSTGTSYNNRFALCVM